MKFLLVAILLICLITTGCSGARIYTFKKDRVDQITEGNQGYLAGTPPQTAKKEVPKRTLIGIDMEVPLLPGEKGYVPTCGDSVIYAEDIKMEPAPKGAIKKEAQTKAEVVYKEETVIVEEEITPKGKKEEVMVEEEEVWVK